METVLKQKKQMIYLPLIVLMFTQIGTSLPHCGLCQPLLFKG